ncbi:MAG: hypothetical protein J0J04_08580 [Microbacterium sp.]|uniref:hypothetical protein n=1 Tax=Microbacterium sp. TaxID=51671 RepID=UPI001ACAD603|nr:hypothetical protein [Microbacterium sp.]MBN9214832.1 hypothetical protein [Microbacterium sp.]
MSAFDEAAHPRGQATNAGQFRDKVNDAPDSALDGGADADEPDFNTWTIPADRLLDLSKAVEKENRRLERAGIEERFTFTHERRVWRDENGTPWLVEDINLNRPRIAVGNWQFLAQHEKTAAGAIITHQTGAGERVAADPSMRCDHCGQFRSRQKVFTLRGRESGEMKQIGSNCLSLFLGTRPEGLWAMAREVGAELRFDEDEVTSGASRAANAFDGDDLMLATIRQVEKDGEYVSRSNAGYARVPTIDKVKGEFTALVSEPASPVEAAEIAAVNAWIGSLEPGEEDDYLQNLVSAFTRDEDGVLVVYSKHAGLAASAISSYRRHVAREAERAAKEQLAKVKLAEFAFTPGESLKGKDLELTVVSMREGQDYGYGAPTHVTLMDEAGHVFYWKSTGYMSAQVELSDGAGYHFMPTEGGKVRITGGTVKEHRVSDFNGDHETVIWRVKVAPTAETVAQFEQEHAQDLADTRARRAAADR